MPEIGIAIISEWPGTSAIVVAIPRNLVCSVVLRCADIKMVRVEARRIVAMVANKQRTSQIESLEDMCGEPANPVIATGNSDLPIAFRRSRPCPEPASRFWVNGPVRKQMFTKVGNSLRQPTALIRAITSDAMCHSVTRDANRLPALFAVAVMHRAMRCVFAPSRTIASSTLIAIKRRRFYEENCPALFAGSGDASSILTAHRSLSLRCRARSVSALPGFCLSTSQFYHFDGGT